MLDIDGNEQVDKKEFEKVKRFTFALFNFSLRNDYKRRPVWKKNLLHSYILNFFTLFTR